MWLTRKLVNSDVGSSAQHLKAAITQLPELRDRKATLDMHMNIAHALLKGIKERQLDSFFQIEENITKQTKAQLLEVINDPERKNPVDKIRMFIIWFLSTENIVNRGDMLEYEAALKNAGCDLASLTYVKKCVFTNSNNHLWDWNLTIVLGCVRLQK